jgi:hypothetical protein
VFPIGPDGRTAKHRAYAAGIKDFADASRQHTSLLYLMLQSGALDTRGLRTGEHLQQAFS